MKMVYVLKMYDEVVGVYADYKKALRDIIEDANDEGIYPDEKALIEKAEARLYKEGDSAWYDILFSTEERDGYEATIYQRPLIK